MRNTFSGRDAFSDLDFAMTCASFQKKERRFASCRRRADRTITLPEFRPARKQIARNFEWSRARGEASGKRRRSGKGTTQK
jgi:hypothetical protein